MKKLNEKFTDLADKVSFLMGQWYVTAFFLVAVLLWFISGPFFNFSDTWQLLVNTPTTILELFIGFLLAASANRSERNNRHMMKELDQLIKKAIREEKKIEEELNGSN